MTKKYYIEIEDCQNNPIAVVKVEAENFQEAKYKALRALHSEDNLYGITKEEAIKYTEENGLVMIDEWGEEVDYDE